MRSPRAWGRVEELHRGPGEMVGWRHALWKYADAQLDDMLSCGWHPASSGKAHETGSPPDELVATEEVVTDRPFAFAEAIALIQGTPPLAQIRQKFGSRVVEKELSAYDALHLRFDGQARLAEALIELHGKQGELIAYDVMVETRVAASKGTTGSIEEFVEDFTRRPQAPNLFTAGLEIELVRKSQREAVVAVRECEWARYFREQHPRVGYLMACSTDEVAYKAFNAGLRMQRTHTIMEGAADCDFRIYGVE